MKIGRMFSFADLMQDWRTLATKQETMLCVECTHKLYSLGAIKRSAVSYMIMRLLFIFLILLVFGRLISIAFGG